MITDLQLLKALLGTPSGKLSSSEESAFQAMYDRIATGAQITLTFKQRSWLTDTYKKLELDKEWKFIPRRVVVKDKSLVNTLDTMDKPLKPPGRK